ncbi:MULTISPECIES: hypothetical protein [unclassified Corallococcus]|uniref:hypothetical protein n=1 Tax=unclassified Corallococcus TaxID=2685029 RepID=UPI001A90A9A6|nr:MULTISPECIES: hypothetical protein [unclassified Corallococcus]MBN9688007.1 hypothetical protein [Corallococcus sp. NCSPR001]WAS88183.1 hypothetical protein O0N60_14650 [Corallococcus sp. NCRR]
MRLYRPVGLAELLLIYRSGMRRFPPRLPEQPIFYPVLNEPYARQISQHWNAASPEGAGYVMAFDVEDAHSASFEVHQVGARMHQELWVPAEALDAFNNHIQGRIRMTAADFGPHFTGKVPESFSLRRQNARTQLQTLMGIHGYNGMDFHGEVTANHEAVFAHFPYWEQIATGNGPQVVESIRSVWSRVFPDIPLGCQPA